MPGRNGGPSVARLREAVARWVEKTSLRQAARETGMSPTGLRKVLGGSRVHASTERKLLAWYVRHVARHADASVLDPETASAALGLLTDGIPQAQRRTVVEGFLRAIERAYVAGEVPVPAWVEAVRGEWAGDP
ncbi:MAG TPA: hypothetical protein VHG51_19655 [Longimicrobiaceae bacterium]|nr:hypothetical protein [Longimicrobiaceae bacterium]